MLDSTLMVLHFLGLALGLSTGFANMVMAGLIAKAAPNEKAVLARFPPAMSRVGAIGLVLLWVSGISIVLTRYGTLRDPAAALHRQAGRRRAADDHRGLHPRPDAARATGRCGCQQRGFRLLGKITGPLALIAIIFAVITFG